MLVTSQNHLVERSMYRQLDADTTIVGARLLATTSDEEIVVGGLLQSLHLVVEVLTHTLGTGKSQLGVGGDTLVLHQAETHLFAVVHSTHIAMFAILALVIQFLEFQSVS